MEVVIMDMCYFFKAAVDGLWEAPLCIVVNKIHFLSGAKILAVLVSEALKPSLLTVFMLPAVYNVFFVIIQDTTGINTGKPKKKTS